MAFDLTSVLTTIAAASASIVAILGGFIASKLIAISSERDEVLSKLQDIDEEIAYRTTVMKAAQEENDEEDALDFILPHVDELPKYDVALVYKHEEHPEISLEKLTPYWVRAKEAVIRFRDAVKEGQNMNSDNVPVGLAEAFRENDFAYEVCKKFGSNIKRLLRQQEREKQRQTGFFDRIDYVSALEDVDLDRTKPLFNSRYGKNEEVIQEQSTAIGWLKLQREQYAQKQKALVKPKGMVEGLVVFGIFSVLCIILPLCFSPFSTTDYNVYRIVKAAFIVVFSLGLISIFSYLIWLLNWKQHKEG